jgi:3-dehydroquinate synthase
MMEKQKVIFSDGLERVLQDAMDECRPDRSFVLVDETTRQLCLPVVADFKCMQGVEPIVIKAGDDHKTLESLTHVWGELQRMGATRHSLLINLGGGMVTDLGGFAAATFKRGLHCINIPTTLLAMVDASVGGKTGINFGSLKNEVGVFRNASAVIIDTLFLRTMDDANLLSGYAEMLKHGLIAERAMLSELLFPLSSLPVPFAVLLEKSVAVKQRIVLEDPTEQGLRKALNLGHTIGHAFESLALRRGHPVLHGYAVAWGLVCELYLSVMKTGFPVGVMRQVVGYIMENYGRMAISCDDYPELLELMTHDKKNTAGRINFSLLSDVGRLCLNQTATKKEIEEALDFYRDGQ